MKRAVALTGFYTALAAFVATVGFGIVQILQVIGVISYPLDAILIYSFSLAIAPPFLMSILALHYLMPEDRRFWSHAALLFALMYAIYVVLMYGVQLATVIPQSLHDPKETILTALPHSFFWTLDGLGYICMGISTFFAAAVFKSDKKNAWLRRFLAGNGLMVPVICIAYFYPHFSILILMIGAPWLITAPGSMLLLALFFRKQTDEL